MKQSRDPEEDEPIDQPQQKQLIVDPQVIKEGWLKRANEEAWIRGILPKINPFLAMDTFRYVKRVSNALATDKTPEGKQLWKAYLYRFRYLFFPLNRYRTDAEEKAKIEEFQTIVGNNNLTYKYVRVLNEARATVMEYRKGYRNSFMWYWLFSRLMAREYAKYLNKVLHDHTLPNIAALSKHITYSVGPNRDVRLPFEIQIVSNGSVIDTVNMGYDTIGIATFLGYYVRFTADVQYAMHRIAGPIIDLVFYTRVLFYVYNLPVQLLADRAALNGNKSLLDDFIDTQKADGIIPQFVLVRPIQESIRIVIETFPQNPEVGPGIYTGQPICSNCQNQPATLICSNCRIGVFCESAECGNCC